MMYSTQIIIYYHLLNRATPTWKLSFGVNTKHFWALKRMIYRAFFLAFFLFPRKPDILFTFNGGPVAIPSIGLGAARRLTKYCPGSIAPCWEITQFSPNKATVVVLKVKIDASRLGDKKTFSFITSWWGRETQEGSELESIPRWG